MNEEEKELEQKSTTEENADGNADENLNEKPDYIIPFMFAVMVVIAAILAGCLIYSGSMNTKLISAAEVLRKDNQMLQEELDNQISKESEDVAVEEETAKPDTTVEPQAAPTEEVQSEPEAEPEPTDNIGMVELNVQNQDASDGEGQQEDDEKVIQEAVETPEFAIYEGTVNNKKFSFEYPGAWDGHVVFTNTEFEDKSVVITCYQTGQYADYQNGLASGTGEIFHILINQSADYRAADNKQYFLGSKDGYYAYYEEPQGITYDYINHADYANDYKLVYDSQQKIWRSFSFL